MTSATPSIGNGAVVTTTSPKTPKQSQKQTIVMVVPEMAVLIDLVIFGKISSPTGTLAGRLISAYYVPPEGLSPYRLEAVRRLAAPSPRRTLSPRIYRAILLPVAEHAPPGPAAGKYGKLVVRKTAQNRRLG